MTDVGRIFLNGYDNNYNDNQEITGKNNIDLEDISILYSTIKKEEDRTTFSNSYFGVSKQDLAQGKAFINSLIANKEDLMEKLGLEEEQYDVLACTALALASQETGMGQEDGYNEENTGIGKFFRDIGKWFSTTFLSDGSASSGLTQMKINDFMNDKNFPTELKEILKAYGVEVSGANGNNLYDNPDKAAVATMVVLKYINDNYDEYQSELSENHAALGAKLADSPEELAAVELEGQETLTKLMEVYENVPDDQKGEIRETVKSWLLSVNGSKQGARGVDKEYNEELNLNKLNQLLQKNGFDFQLTERDLDLIRYTLTAPGQEMSRVEYMAYGWNKGTGTTGMQLDRMLAEKMGTLMQNPEDLDYDQFTSNVAAMAERYANQSVGADGTRWMDEAFG